MHIDPRDSIRHLRLARALAGTELEGMALIEEIASISKLASHYAEDHYGDSGKGPDLNVLEDAFRTIARHSTIAIKRCAAVTEAAQSFIHDLDVPEFDTCEDDDAAELWASSGDEDDANVAPTGARTPAKSVSRRKRQ